MKDPKFVAPTLPAAIRQLAKLDDAGSRGFVFVRPDGTERFCSWTEVCFRPSAAPRRCTRAA